MNSSKAQDKGNHPPTESGRPELVENLEAIRQLPIFKDIPHDIIKLHAYTAKRRHYSAGDIIFHKGDTCRRAYLILFGEVTLFLEEEDRILELQALHSTNFFGYMALIAEFKWPISSRARSDAEILTLDRESFRKILMQFPDKCVAIVEKVVQMRMERMERHMAALMEQAGDKHQILNLSVLNM